MPTSIAVVVMLEEATKPRVQAEKWLAKCLKRESNFPRIVPNLQASDVDRPPLVKQPATARPVPAD